MNNKISYKKALKSTMLIDLVLIMAVEAILTIGHAKQAPQTPQMEHKQEENKGDYTLEIYGNADGDASIDKSDITYVKKIIACKKNVTKLADANHDGKINKADVEQIKSIIHGRESELTIVDGADRIVTVEMPVKRLIPTNYRATESLLAIGAKDLIVGVNRTFHERMSEFGLEDLPEVAQHSKFIDYEAILALEPDLVVLPTRQAKNADDIAEHLPGIPVIAMGCTNRKTMIPDLKTLGMLLGKEKRANEFTDWIEKYDGLVEKRTQELKPEEKPTFYYEYMSGTKKWGAITPKDPSAGQVAERCGGRNIVAGFPGTNVEVDPEWVIKKDPDVMFADLMRGSESGPGKTEADLKKKLDEVLADRPVFEKVSAVKNHRVYLIDRDIVSGPRWIIGHLYFAKWLHPGLFKDIHPEKIHKEYLKKFHGLEIEGTWAYPPPSSE